MSVSKTSAATLKPADATTRARLNEAYGNLPLSFEINQGQADAKVKFLSIGANYSILLSPNEVALNLSDAELKRKGDPGGAKAKTTA